MGLDAQTRALLNSICTGKDHDPGIQDPQPDRQVNLHTQRFF